MLRDDEKDHFIVDSVLYSLPPGLIIKVQRKEIGESVTMISGVSQKDFLGVYYQYTLSWEYLQKSDRDRVIKLYNDAQSSKKDIVLMIREEPDNNNFPIFTRKEKCVLNDLKEGTPVTRDFFNNNWVYKDIEIKVL